MKKLASNSKSTVALKEHRTRGERFAFHKRRLANVNVEELWVTLELGLRVGAGRKNLEKINAALDDVEHNLRRAGTMFQIAVDECEEFDLDYEAAYSEWERRARESLSKEKLKGQVTSDMIRHWISANVAAYREWQVQRQNLRRAKALSESMKRAWESRAATLRKMADTVAQRRGVDPDQLPRRERGEGDEG